MSDSDTEDATEQAAGITVYWRPGCGFCASLLRHLDQLKIPFAKVDIWSDPAGAAFVRSVARGNETVPTVAIGSIALVNPTAQQVLAEASKHAPAAVPANLRNR